PAWLAAVECSTSTTFFFEVPPDRERFRDVLAAVRAARFRGETRIKLRCGGLEPAAFPSSEQLAPALTQCVSLGFPFQAAAGPPRALPRFDEGVQARMHGFVNLFTAAIFCWSQGLDVVQTAAILDSSDPAAFHFDDHGLRWRDWVVTTEQLRQARHSMALSFGSWSFHEPRADLRAPGLLWGGGGRGAGGRGWGRVGAGRVLRSGGGA